jgi:hypothetical protein
MLDKNSILDLLNLSEKETIYHTHQSMGKTDFICRLMRAINSGEYDIKDNKIKDEIDLNKNIISEDS